MIGCPNSPKSQIGLLNPVGVNTISKRQGQRLFAKYFFSSKNKVQQMLNMEFFVNFFSTIHFKKIIFLKYRHLFLELFFVDPLL